MATRIKLIITVITVITAITTSLAQTSDVKDVQVAKVKLQIGTNAAKYLSSLAETISGAATHNQSPTAKAVYDYIQSLNIIATGTTAAGDLDGTYPSPTVDGLQNRPVASTAPSSGNLLRWNGTSWAPSSTADGNGIYGGSGTTGAPFTAVTVDSIIRFNTTDPAGRFIANVSGGSDVAGLLIADTLSQLSYDDPGGTNLVEVNNEGISLTTLTSDRVVITGKDARYAANYSAGFSVRSLVDKGYVDGSLSAEVSIPDTEIALGNASGDGLTSYPGLAYDGSFLAVEGDIDVTGNNAAVVIDDIAASSPSQGGTVYLNSKDGAALASGDRIGGVIFIGGTGGGGTATGATIDAFTAGAWGSSDAPGKIVFSTTPDGSDVPVAALNILSTGALQAPEYGTGTFTGTAAYTLQVDASGNVIEGAVSAGAEVNVPATIRPAQITATTNDYNPTGYSTTKTQYMEVTGDASFRTITGLTAATRDGVTKTIANTGTNCYILAKEHTGSSAANRLKLVRDVVMYPGMEATLRYDSVNTYWRLAGSNEASIYYGNRIVTTLNNNTGSVQDADNPTYAFGTNGGTWSANTTPVASTPKRRSNATTSTAATAFPSISAKNQNGTFYLVSGSTYVRMYAKIYTDDVSLSTNAESYEYRFGFEDGVDTTLSHGAVINYHHTENSGGWVLKTTNSGASTTSTNAGSPIATNTFYDLELVYYPYGEVTCWIDGARYTTTSTLPGAVAIVPFLMLDKDNGTTSRSMKVMAFDTFFAWVNEQ